MTTQQIQELQRHVGAVPDGFWGPRSIAACQRHLRSLMPAPHPWPGTSQAALTAFYGAPGEEDRLMNLDVAGLGLRYEGRPVATVRCHARVGASLHRVLTALAVSHPAVLADFAGCYNHRPMRGGSLPSLHARGAAVDFLPGTNGNRTAWPATATMPIGVMEAFAREGWTPAGAFWGRDAMHFQATR